MATETGKHIGHMQFCVVLKLIHYTNGSNVEQFAHTLVITTQLVIGIMYHKTKQMLYVPIEQSV